MTEAMTMSLLDETLGGVVGDAVEDAAAEKPSAVDVAARFVALQPGGARRILIEHDRRPDGTCGGCLTSPVTWPCVVSAIAKRAQGLDPATL